MNKKSRAMAKVILEIGLPELPEGQRWFIRCSSFDAAIRYLFLEKKGLFGWRKVRSEMIYTGRYGKRSFEGNVREAAEDLLRELKNIDLPVGEAR